MGKPTNIDGTHDVSAQRLSRRELLRGVGGLSVLAFVGACAPTTTQPAGATAATAPSQITVGVGTLSDQIVDPLGAGSGGRIYPLKWAIGEELVRLDDGKFVPNLATNWTQSADGLLWELTLRPGVKMHDGSTFTALDLQTTIERYKKQSQSGNPRFTSTDKRLLEMGVKVLDDTHVQLTLKTPWPSMLQTATMGPTPTDYYNKVGEVGFLKQPMGSGPFKFVSQEFNQSVTFERFEDFWDKPRLPNFKTLVYKIVPEESSRVAGVRSGSLDLVDAIGTAGIAELQGDTKVKVLIAESASNCGAFFYDFGRDPKNSPFLDLRVRQALLYAIDREAIAKSIYKGLATVPASIMGGTGTRDNSLTPFPYDPAKARQLLSAAGASNLSFNIWAPTGIPGSDGTMASALAGYWDAVGVKGDVKVVDEGQYMTARYGLKVDGIGLINRQWLLFLEPSFWPGIFSTSGPQSGFVDGKLFSMADQWSKTIDLQARARLAGEVERYVYDQTLGIPTVFLSAAFAAGPHVDWKPQVANPYAGPVWYMRAK